MKYINTLVFLIVLVINVVFNGVEGAGECGKSSPNTEAFKLAPCASAGQNEGTTPSSSCCTQVQTFVQNPKCLCAVILSPTTTTLGLKSEVVITIPKRCNLADRPVGYKCGAYTLPLRFKAISNAIGVPPICYCKMCLRASSFAS